MNRNKEPEVWIAHCESDCSIARLLSEGLDRQLISVLNDYIEYHLRSGEDEIDVITNSIMQSDIVIALITQLTDAEDVISQIKRARTFKKRLITVLYGENDLVSPALSNIELAELLSGSPHIYALVKNIFIDLVDLIKESTTAKQSTNLIKESSSQYEIFISKKSEDFLIAKKVYDFLTEKGYRVFLSEVSLPAIGSSEYMKAIDEALEHAKHLIVIGTKAENLLSGWVEAEWRVFINEKRSGRKSGNIITVVPVDTSINILPMSLRYYEVIPFSELAKLLPFMC